VSPLPLIRRVVSRVNLRMQEGKERSLLSSSHSLSRDVKCPIAEGSSLKELLPNCIHDNEGSVAMAVALTTDFVHLALPAGTHGWRELKYE
jgi:hypothetical protein